MESMSAESPSELKKKKPVQFSWCQFFALVILFVVTAAAVGVAVYFTTRCDETDVSSPIFEEYTSPRLPDTLTPQHYDLWIQPFLATEDSNKNFTFTGTVDITVRCNKVTNRIFVNWRNLVIDESSVLIRRVGNLEDFNVSSRPNIEVHSIEYDITNEYVVINLWKKLQPNKSYAVFIKFKGKLNDDLRGFYRSSYLAEDSSTR